MLSKLFISTMSAAILAGCSVETFTYTMDRYGEVRGRQVRLGCRDTYEAFDRPEARSLLVVTNGVNEALASSCSSPARAERMRRVAEIYLAETSARPECQVVRARGLTEFHTEFSYRCEGRQSQSGRRSRS
jgi:hypothetical protein